MSQEDSYQIETTASPDQLESRRKLSELFERVPIPLDDKLFNIGLFTRSTVLVKFLVLSDVYQRIQNIPGNFVEFGTWWGQNMVLLENLRAIYEPFNKQRTILGFDTFSGYTDLSEKDKKSDVWGEGSYSTGEDYVDLLAELLATHEGSNCLGHIRNVHKLIKGDVTKTAPEYFANHKEAIVAFAYFDMGLYEPTKSALQAIKPHLVSGSILLMDELTWQESPGESIALKEVFQKDEYLLEKCSLYPSKCLVTIR